ncbi:MAG: 50S ribosomal protein L25 [Acidobacteria bacterium]|nr:50S ribosomal protein L25 [Acidobacteriota bacterium]MCW5948899.1 50S ribosomal protein L25 [Pyrinomonadaceae bacterium]
MADKLTVKATVRETRGKNENRRLRAEGKVPVVVYGGGTENVAATAELKDLAAVLRLDTGVNTVFTLDIEGAGASDVIFQDRQIDPIRGRLIHADLRRFAKGEKIEMTVPVHVVGDAVGLQEEGAVLSQQMREMKVLCEPAAAPDFIEIDVTSLEAGSSLHVSDVKVPSGIEIHESPDSVVVAVSIVRDAPLESQVEEGAEPELVGGNAENASTENEGSAE